MSIEEIRENAEELFKQSEYSAALPLYEQAAEMGDVYSATNAALLNALNAKASIAVFKEFEAAEKEAERALYWYGLFKDIDSPAIDMVFNRPLFLRTLGFCYYRLAVRKRGQETEGALLYTGFTLLCDVVDDSEDFPDTQSLWALTVQRMRDMDRNLSGEAVAKKNELYQQMISAKKEALLSCDNGEALLSKIYVDYGFVLLENSELPADHTKAYRCFKNALALGIQSAESILKKFVETAPGEYRFIGG